MKLHFEGDKPPDDLARFGEITSQEGPIAALSVDRGEVAHVLNAILDAYKVVDMSVQDPPLDQVIARVFEEARPRDEHAVAAD